MGDGGRRHHPLRFQLDRGRRGAVEEADAAAQQERHDVDLKFVHEPGCQALLDDARPAGEGDVQIAGRRAGLLDRRADAAGDEVERRAALLDERLALVMGEDEDGHVEGRIVAPPGVGVRIRLPRPRAAAEHLAAHHDGADAARDLRDDLVVGAVGVAALHAVSLAPALEPDDPFVQPLAALAERVLEARVGPGDVAVQRHGDIELQLRHGRLLCIRCRR